MNPKLSLVLLIALCAACQPDESGGPGAAGAGTGISLAGPNSNFLVKMTSSMSAAGNEPGDTITAVVIAPVPLRGGRVEGTIDKADHAFLGFTFHTLHFEGKTYSFDSEVTSVVSSKGNAGRDDLDQRIRVAGGTVIAYGTTTAIDEGAEIRFVAWEE